MGKTNKMREGELSTIHKTKELGENELTVGNLYGMMIKIGKKQIITKYKLLKNNFWNCNWFFQRKGGFYNGKSKAIFVYG